MTLSDNENIFDSKNFQTYGTHCSCMSTPEQVSKAHINFTILFHVLIIGIPVWPVVKSMFSEIRCKYGDTVYDVVTAVVENSGLETVKSYLGTVHPDMKTKLEAVRKDADLQPLVREYCLFPSIQLLQSLACRFAEGLPKVEQALAKFVEERDQLYRQVLIKDFVTEVRETQRASHAKVHVFISR